MAITPPVPIDAGPALPSSSDSETTFDAAFEAFLSWQKNQLQPQTNALAANVYSNAQAAETAASTAVGARDDAADSASAANADALRLASLDALWLGAAASDPATGRGGAPLVAGNAYVNSGTGLLRTYNGTAWVNALNVTAGVTSVDGTAGTVTLKTVGGASLVGTGDVAVTAPFSRVAQYTASSTFVVPAGASVIRPYAFGAGAAGTTANSGGGGGCAYGDIAVTPGATVTLSIAAGVAKVTYGGVDLLIANPASGVTGGTASKHASVTNGGAYSGGAGAASSGGASSGSPLGAGVAGNAFGGSGWGGSGIAGGGGGAGAAGADGFGGSGLPAPSTDPLLSPLTGAPGGSANNNASTAYGGAGSIGSGGGVGNGLSGFGGAAGFGGGGGAGFGGGAGNAATGGAGGFGGGGGRASSVGATAIGGAGGFGGGGGSGASAGGAGGAAVIRIYY